ncbi:hypothetical protein OEZ85_009253 [Tetradesmus obliquus]|uniref:Uncharacterized protein n=1 Tax=Tetradesmus obliquus TaxID=3088 RepID=A0ABY8UAT9_TETOB|nr:hypothetical protein OEZ85_009253 [Tetradesmus obliquus]
MVGSGQLMGLQKGMREKSLMLAPHEGINRIDLKYDKRCIKYMRLYTTVGASETIGAAVTAPSTKMAVALPLNSTWQLLAFRGTQQDGM